MARPVRAGFAALCLALQSRPTHSWGEDGHAIIAGLAARRLSKTARAKVGELLQASDDVEQAMMDVASWADKAVHESAYRWSVGLHFLNVQDEVNCWNYDDMKGPHDCKMDYQRDCPNDYCNIGAIKNYTQQLRANAGDKDSATDALKFVIHFHGDIHQPLHCALANDRGGVKINVVFHVNDQGDDWNLHNIWDFGMIVDKEGKEGQTSVLTNELQNLLDGDWATTSSSWAQETNPSVWAQESLDAATKVAYRFPNGTAIPWHPDDHDKFVLPVNEFQQSFMKPGGAVDLQLAKAAVRLAATLNSIWPDEAAALVV
eukprot:TRINITY_DN112879_c0_g1_i1.p1 TRINITY_DN112879_c0_g1~~TRINITY_DN112879_c0_g1_i1.p1  ORF type:complete len:331 (-),score=55.60 TRINITY_DN112879_c0_g1_i1:259-1206(-)